MVRGLSEISVRITGDASGLNSALGSADKGVGISLGKIGAGLAAVGAVKAGFDFAGQSLDEFDRLGDATARLQYQLGPLADQVESTSTNFLDLGASKQDILELAANFADLGTGADLSDAAIASNATNVAALATATSLLGDQSPDEVVDLIGKAAKGSVRPLQDLGVTLDDGAVKARAMADSGKSNASELTKSELAGARLALIMEQLSPKLDDATSSSGDLEQKQSALQARVETLQAQLGEKLSPALETVLGFIIDEIDAIPGAIEGFRLLGEGIVNFAEDALGPVARLFDVLGNIAGIVGGVVGGVGDLLGGGGGGGESSQVRNSQNYRERNGLSGTMGNP